MSEFEMSDSSYMKINVVNHENFISDNFYRERDLREGYSVTVKRYLALNPLKSFLVSLVSPLYLIDDTNLLLV